MKHSGRVGRTADAKRFDADALTLAVRAHVRHVHTEYDALLTLRWERHEARARILPVIDAILADWSRR